MYPRKAKVFTCGKNKKSKSMWKYVFIAMTTSYDCWRDCENNFNAYNASYNELCRPRLILLDDLSFHRREERVYIKFL